ncbi:MAG: NAD(P)-dependent oxidoreductase [Actinomycetota bacterium]|nr:NAD(P)-dependent oxidoreductase [Actinomycetota bacterium]MED5394204.1 NAD(P)-dependent oxidoreductase [Actinomycetota bacterium]MED6328281.1 NAD(P)-dependent oxidoreductase [Actinomycetota bacterium]MEE2957777.1 NAD(P)-dependent oxidoreductase [Actinomycetota bacterium]
MRIACLGLGRMGWPIAGHLANRGEEHDIVVFDVVDGLGSRWAGEHRGAAADSVASAVDGAQFVITSLPADRELAAVAEEALAAVGRGTVWIDHSTTSARIARELGAEVSAAGGHFLDGPVSGGVDGAQRGTLTVMVGGDKEAFAAAEPLIDVYASRVRHMGPVGSGQLTKMTNQICVVGLCQALAEGLDFASRAGLDVEQVVEAMVQGSSTSWQMENRADRMLAGDYDFGFSTTLMRKDVGLVLEEASAMGVSLPVTALVGQFLADVDAMGGESWDWCSLMERQRRFAPENSSPK